MKNSKTKKSIQSEPYQMTQEALELVDQITNQQIGIFSAGSSHESLGINDGDRVLVQLCDDWSENQLMAVRFFFRVVGGDSIGINGIGYCYDNFGEACMRLAGGTIMQCKNAQVLGRVVAVIKPYDADKFNPFGTSAEVAPESEEITLICSECKTELSGTPKFLKSMGWKLKGKPLCLNCDLY